MRTTLFFIFCISFFISLKISANTTSSVYISEVLTDAIGSDSGKEYIELYNNTASSISLENWYLLNFSQSGTFKKISLPSINIDKNSYFLIAENLTEVTSNSLSIGSGKLAFYNDFGKVQLFNSTSNIVNEFNYGDSVEGYSWEFEGPLCTSTNIARINTPGFVNSGYKSECFVTPLSYPEKIEDVKFDKIEFSLDNLTWTDKLSAFVNDNIYFRYKLSNQNLIENVKWTTHDGLLIDTPYKFNNKYNNSINLEFSSNNKVYKFSSSIIDIKSYISNKVIITEVYPSPESPDMEWLEIFNLDNKTVNLNDYFIEERSSLGITNKKISLPKVEILPQSHYVIYENQLSISLNNSGDDIYLIDIYGNLIDTFTYPESDKAKSFGRVVENNAYVNIINESLTPTPLNYNKFGETTKKILPYNIIDISNLPLGTLVVVNVNINNIFGKSIYIEDSTGSLRATSEEIISQDFVNSTAKLEGKIIETSTGKSIQLTPGKIQIINYFTPDYRNVDVNNLTTADIGKLVTISGEIEEIYTNRLRIKVNDKLISIYSNNMSSLNLSKNSIINVNGTIDFYRGNFRILELESRILDQDQTKGSVLSVVSYPVSQPTTEVKRLSESTYIDSSQSLVIFGYISLLTIFIIELFKNKHYIHKRFKVILLKFSSRLSKLKGKIKVMIKSKEFIINKWK